MTDKTLREAAEETLKLLDERIWRNDQLGYETRENLRAALADSADASELSTCSYVNASNLSCVREEGHEGEHYYHLPDAPEGPWKVRNHDEIEGYYEVYNSHDFDIPRHILQGKRQASDFCDALNRLDAQQKR